MMDAPSMFPNGFHPCDVFRDRGGTQWVKTIPRHRASGPIRYYFINFRDSVLFEPDEEHLVYGSDRADQDVPEMPKGFGDVYNPFPADVFIIGNIFKKHFIPVSLLYFILFTSTELFPHDIPRCTRTLTSSPRWSTP